MATGNEASGGSGVGIEAPSGPRVTRGSGTEAPAAPAGGARAPRGGGKAAAPAKPAETEEQRAERAGRVEDASQRAAFKALKGGKGVAGAKQAASRTQRLAPDAHSQAERAANAKPRFQLRDPAEDVPLDANLEYLDEGGATRDKPEVEQPARGRKPAKGGKPVEEPAEEEPEVEERAELEGEDDDEQPEDAPQGRRQIKNQEGYEKALRLARAYGALPQAAIDAMSETDLIQWATHEAKRAETHRKNTERLAALEKGDKPATPAGTQGSGTKSGGAAGDRSAGAPGEALDFSEDFQAVSDSWGKEFGEALTAATSKAIERALKGREQHRGDADARLAALGGYVDALAERAIRAELRNLGFQDVSKPDVWKAIKQRAERLAAPDREGEASPYASQDDPLSAVYLDAAKLILGAPASGENTNADSDNPLANTQLTPSDSGEEPAMGRGAGGEEGRQRMAFKLLGRGKSVSEVRRRIGG